MGISNVRDIPKLLKDPLGRRKLLADAHHLIFPVTKVAAHLYRRSLLRYCMVVTVVGSYGKTTTAKATALALGLDPEQVPAFNLKGYVARNILSHSPLARRAVLEVGVNRRGQMKELAWMVQPDVVIVTSIGSEHNRSFKTLEGAREEKAEMVRVLRNTGVAVLNGDDPNVRWMAGLTPARKLFYGYGEENDLRVRDYRLNWPAGASGIVEVEGKSFRLETGLIGRHLFLAAVAALGAAHALGIPVVESTGRLVEMKPQHGRLRPRPLSNGVILLQDDFKSSFETIEEAIRTLGTIPAKRKILVLGEVSEPPGRMGPIYRELGRQLGAVADRFIVVGHNFQRYAVGASEVGMSRESMFNAGNDFSEGGRILQEIVEPGDVVLIKGRDNARLERIALMLQDVPVGCRRKFCRGFGPCHECPLLVQS